MKKDILKIAGVKSEAEFYKKYPTEEAFMAKHGGAFKKAAMGKAMVKKQLTQLTDFSNPPIAQDGRVQRAADANLRSWERCARASSADNGKGGGKGYGGYYETSKYKNPYEEVSDINAYDKDERKNFKKTLPAGIDINDWVAFNRDANRFNAQLNNPAYNNWFDSTGTLVSDKQKFANNMDPWFLYYKPAFMGKTRVSPEDIMNYHMNQPEGIAGYKELVNRRYMPKQEDGGETPEYQYSGKPLKANLQKPSFMQPFNFNAPAYQQYQPMGLPDSRSEDLVDPSIYDITGVNRNYAKPLGTKPTAKTTKSPQDPSGIMEGIQNTIGGAQQWSEDSKTLKKYKMWGNIADLSGKAMATRDRIKNKYVRPEDIVFDPNQLSPSYGTGYDVLQSAKDGMQVGGNLTEIQNTYNPGDIYSDLGYEPLNDSEQVKQYQNGGGLFANWQEDLTDFGATNAGSLSGTLGNLVGGGHNQMTGASKTLTGVGQLAGTAIGGPLGGVVGGAIGGLVGGVIGSGQEKRMRRDQQRIDNLSFQQGAIGMQNRYSGFMEDGGWVSNDWQPQVISKFGEYDLRDLLKSDPTMDTLRAGGHLKNYTAPSEEAMETYGMGGDLKVDPRGEIDFMGYNPETAKTGASGYVGISRGPSHDNGGFDIDYAGNKVEIEGGETVVEKKDGGSVNGENSLIVLGDMKVGNQGDAIKADVNKETLKRILKGKELKDVKFKHIGNEIAKRTKHLNKAENKYVDMADSVDGNSSFDLLKLNTAKAGLDGVQMQYKDLNNLQTGLVDLQTAYHDAAEEHGYDDTPKFLEDVKKGKVKQQAAMGGKFSMAQDGETFKSMFDYRKPQTFTQGPGEGIPQWLKPWTKAKTPKGGVSATTGKPTTYDVTKGNSLYDDYGYWKKLHKGDFEDLADYQGFVFDTLKDKDPEALDHIMKNWGMPSSGTFADRYAGARTQEAGRKRIPEKVGPIDIPTKKINNTPPDMIAKVPTVTQTAKTKSNKFKLIDAYNMLSPYLKPLIQNPLDPRQLAGEMYQLATNQVEPVQAQKFIPQLETPYSVSFQDQMNANQADFNAMAQRLGNNPSALSALAAQKYAANSSVLGQQNRANQELQMGAYNRNRQLINDASLKNLAVLDQQYVRQSQAKSNTKAQTYEALRSIGDKYARNRTETLAANVQANMYPDYTFGPKGRIYKTGLTEFNIPTIAKSGKKLKSNGSIVKALKNI